LRCDFAHAPRFLHEPGARQRENDGHCTNPRYDALLQPALAISLPQLVIGHPQQARDDAELSEIAERPPTPDVGCQRLCRLVGDATLVVDNVTQACRKALELCHAL
jgi:hypothetical protein